MQIRMIEPGNDFKDVCRIWHEIGWLGKDKEEEKALKFFLEGSKSYVAVINEDIEGFVNSTPGKLQYLEEELDLQAITAVTISRVARKQGIAGRMTAKAVAEAAEKGFLVSGLSMFEQGFYNRLGFGTGGYEHFYSFDPNSINLDIKPRMPKRIYFDDWKLAHQARVKRSKKHGYCTLLPPQITQAEMYGNRKKGFGLGYFDSDGLFSHYFWCVPDKVGNGPYYIDWMVYNTKEEFLELMGLLKSMSDQVFLFKMREPAGIQLQDLIKQPFKERQVRKGSTFELNNRASAYWQMRILDLKGCLAKTHLNGNQICVNLNLSDPIYKYLPADSRWRGLTGKYILNLGADCSMKLGFDKTLPTLSASVGAFTRMWLGVRPASGLAATDQLSGPVELLKKLDLLFRVPEPKVDWDF